MLTTPDAIRTLQRKLYTKAKLDPAYRFYALYDKISRAEVLAWAATIILSGITTIILAGGEESKAA